MIIQNSEPSSSGLSDRVWNPNLLRRKAKRATSELSGVSADHQMPLWMCIFQESHHLVKHHRGTSFFPLLTYPCSEVMDRVT